jgi:hypothetical protein
MIVSNLELHRAADCGRLIITPEHRTRPALLGIAGMTPTRSISRSKMLIPSPIV